MVSTAVELVCALLIVVGVYLVASAGTALITAGVLGLILSAVAHR